MRRIGIYGGTFNPVHDGHLLVAEDVKRLAGLDEVIFVPSGTPPQKGGRDLAPAKDRLFMVESAIRGKDGFSVSDMEVRQEGPSYTVKTLKAFRETSPDDHLFFILGMDAMLGIRSWKDWQHLLTLSEFLVMTRPETDGKRLDAVLADYSRNGDTYTRKGVPSIRLVPVTAHAASSTRIRDGIRQHGEARDLDPAVLHHIRIKGLYR